MKLKHLTAALVGGAMMATLAGVSWAETTMEKIVRTGEMTIAVQTQGPPVSFINKDGERTGLAVELARMMAEDMGVELVVQDYDWKGLIPALTSGKADFIAADMTPTAQRSMQIMFTEPVFYAETVAFTQEGSDFTSWEDLNTPDVTLAATQASSYATAARKFLPEAELKEFSGGTAQAVQAVMSGRATAGVTDKATLSGFQSSIEGIKLLEGELNREPLGFAVRPDSTHLLHSLDNYFRLIRIDGRLEDKVDYWWNTTDWEADHK